MTLYTLPNSTSGMDAILVDTVEAVPSLAPMILAFVFFVVFLGGMARQRARTGENDFWMWGTVASLATFMIATIMSLTSGLIQLTWLVITLVITIGFGVGLFLSKRSSEI